MEACWHCQAPHSGPPYTVFRSRAAEEARRRDERPRNGQMRGTEKSALFSQEKMKMKKMALQLYHAQPGDDVSKLQSNLANRASKEKSRAAETRKVPRSRAPPVSQLALLWRERAFSRRTGCGRARSSSVSKTRTATMAVQVVPTRMLTQRPEHVGEKTARYSARRQKNCTRNPVQSLSPRPPFALDY